MNKKMLGVSLTTVTMFLVMLPSVFALLENNIVVNYIRQIFTDGAVSPWIMKFAIFWLVFSIFYAVTRKAEFLQGANGGKGVPITIAIVLAALASVGMPSKVAKAIFNLYGGIFSAILLLLPFGLMIYIFIKTEKKTPMTHLMLAISFFFLGAILTTQWFQAFIPALIYKALNDPLEIGGIILIILGIMEFFMIFRSYNANKEKYDSGTGDYGGGSGKSWWPFRSKTPQQLQEKEARREANKAIEEKKKREKEAELEKERAQAEELGQFIGSVAADAGKRLETLKDGSEKLHKVTETPDVRLEQTLPEVDHNLVEPLINEVKTMHDNFVKAKTANMRHKVIVQQMDKAAKNINLEEGKKIKISNDEIEDYKKSKQEITDLVKTIKKLSAGTPENETEKKNVKKQLRIKKNQLKQIVGVTRYDDWSNGVKKKLKDLQNKFEEQTAQKKKYEATIEEAKQIQNLAKDKAIPDDKKAQDLIDNQILPRLDIDNQTSLAKILYKIKEKINATVLEKHNPRAMGVFKGEVKQHIAQYDAVVRDLEANINSLKMDADNMLNNLADLERYLREIKLLDKYETKGEKYTRPAGTSVKKASGSTFTSKPMYREIRKKNMKLPK